ncbi:MAG: DUF1592 domain-containing protein, partial [Myxococcota bacterium]|nr:DUF1592 domain-containing protein [Myxococcota bacterium]
MILLLLACSGLPDPPSALVPLESPQLLRRMSLDLRGTLPTVEELDAVAEDPSLLEAMRDTFLDDPRLEERLVMLLAEQWHTRVDVFGAEHGDFFLSDEDEYGFERSVGEEPLRLVAHVAVHDLPYSEIVTADYTLANEMLASIWPLDYPDQAEGWQISTWTDG